MKKNSSKPHNFKNTYQLISLLLVEEIRFDLRKRLLLGEEIPVNAPAR
jgi:hypothetical protein